MMNKYRMVFRKNTAKGIFSQFRGLKMREKVLLLVALSLAFCMTAGCSGEKKPSTETTTDYVEETTRDYVEETTGSSILQAGPVSDDPRGWIQKDTGEQGLYFQLEANEIPADQTWSVRYEPVSVRGLHLIRLGQRFDISGRLVKFSDTEWYLCLDPWLMEGHGALQAGDVIALQGKFQNTDNGLKIQFDTTYITLEEDYSITISTEEPTGPA